MNDDFDVHPDAAEDLAAIWRYSAESWSVDQADRYLNTILDAVDAFVGGRDHASRRTRDDRFAIVRCGSYHAYIACVAERFELVRVLHQSMDAARHLPPE